MRLDPQYIAPHENTSRKAHRNTRTSWAIWSILHPTPDSHVFLPWQEDMRARYAYGSAEPQFTNKSGKIETLMNELDPKSALNALHETVVGILIQEYFKKFYPESKFFFASKYDDYFCGTDFLVHIPEISDTWIRIDLSLSDENILTFQDIEYTSGVRKKMHNFHATEGIPEEFFATRLWRETPQSLPLIILRVDGPIIDTFFKNFFSMLRGNPERDILDVFRVYMNCLKIPRKDGRIAYTLGLQKETTPEKSDDLARVEKRLKLLFAWRRRNESDIC